MQMGKTAGWFLLVAAFLLAAAESAAQAISGEYGIMGAARVMEVLIPAFYVELAGTVRSGLHPFAWDPLLMSLLALPGWFLTGVPGAALAWRFRTRPMFDDEEDELPYTTYDDIKAAADEEAELHGDGEPSKYRDMGEFDPTDAEQVDADMDALFVTQVLQHGGDERPDPSEPFQLTIHHQADPPPGDGAQDPFAGEDGLPKKDA